MVKQYIELGDSNWGIVACYNVDDTDSKEITALLEALGCPEDNIKRAVHIITHRLNCALTFSNTDLKMSLVCIGRTSSRDQLINSMVHEAKHVQTHVCQYYGIDEDEEKAAYMIGYIVQKMYIMLSRLDKYGRF